MTATRMQSRKDFDCVAMKQHIQEELARKQTGQSRDSLNHAAERAIAADPHLKRLLSVAAPNPASVRKAG